MTQPGTSAAAPAADIVITRVFRAPRELVFRAWTEPEHLKRWWSPANFTCPYARIDLRVGGSYLYCMESPDGEKYWSGGVYREIEAPRRIVSTDYFSNEAGEKVAPRELGMGDDVPDEMLVTVTFEEEGAGTRMTLVHSGVPAGEMAEATRESWGTMLDKLSVSVETP